MVLIASLFPDEEQPIATRTNPDRTEILTISIAIILALIIFLLS